MELDQELRRRALSIFGILVICILLQILSVSSSRRISTTNVNSRTGGIEEDCIIPLSALPNRNLPLLYSRGRGLLLPRGSRSIAIKYNESVQVSCPGKDNSIVDQRAAHLSVKCINRGQVIRVTRSLPLNMNCTKSLAESVQETREPCGARGNSKKIEIGWNLSNMGFLRQIEVCFNEDLLSTEYTKHIIRGSAMHYGDRSNKDTRHPGFRLDEYFSRQIPSISKVYTIENQRETLTNLLGSSEKALTFIGGWGNCSYLARGHLSPDADFALKTLKDATYHYINVVPQWQEFNNGNWKILEGEIRSKARGPPARDLDTYTGTHGVLTLPGFNNNEVQINLLNGSRVGVPVPRYIWKVVLDSTKNKAVAFILDNYPANPLFPDPQPFSLCPDVCNRIRWVRFNTKGNKKKGFIYCCSLEHIINNVPSIPNLPHAGLMET